VFDAVGCTASYNVNIPNAGELVLVLSPTASIAEGGSIQINPVLNIPAAEVASVAWSPAGGLSCTDCLQPTASPDSTTAYTVTVTSVDGCTASASVEVTVTVIPPKGNVFVPNAFSPNGDGINDVLLVFADEKEVREVTSFRVFTRWGEAVFEGFGLQPNEPTHGWDGTHRGKDVDMGTFVWYAEVELVNGERRVVKGDVAVVW
jgi:gliding motility-associated-like protein